MKIRSVKKTKKLQVGDVIYISTIDQNDAGVYSDITKPNIVAVVEKVKTEGKISTILTSGGYEFSFHKNQLTFVLGTIESVEKDAELLFQTFNNSDTSAKQVNKAINFMEDIDSMLEIGSYASKK